MCLFSNFSKCTPFVTILKEGVSKIGSSINSKALLPSTIEIYIYIFSLTAFLIQNEAGREEYRSNTASFLSILFSVWNTER